MSTKCETARHDQMPECANSRHVQCEICGRCYTCEGERSRKEMLEGSNFSLDVPNKLA